MAYITTAACSMYKIWAAEGKKYSDCIAITPMQGLLVMRKLRTWSLEDFFCWGLYCDMVGYCNTNGVCCYINALMHRKPNKLLSLPTLMESWMDNAMNFITGLPLSSLSHGGLK